MSILCTAWPPAPAKPGRTNETCHLQASQSVHWNAEIATEVRFNFPIFPKQSASWVIIWCTAIRQNANIALAHIAHSAQSGLFNMKLCMDAMFQDAVHRRCSANSSNSERLQWLFLKQALCRLLQAEGMSLVCVVVGGHMRNIGKFHRREQKRPANVSESLTSKWLFQHSVLIW